MGTNGVPCLASLAQIFPPVPVTCRSKRRRRNADAHRGPGHLSAALDADYPYAIAGAAWYMNHIFRDARRNADEAYRTGHQNVQAARTRQGRKTLARYVLLQLAVACPTAKIRPLS